MKGLSASLLRIAEEILPQLRITFKRNKDAEERDYNSIHFEMQRFICTLRGNEELVSKVSRIDDDKAMVLVIGLSEHEEMDGIVRELGKMAKKLGKRAKLEVEVGDVHKSA